MVATAQTLNTTSSASSGDLMLDHPTTPASDNNTPASSSSCALHVQMQEGSGQEVGANVMDVTSCSRDACGHAAKDKYAQKHGARFMGDANSSKEYQMSQLQQWLSARELELQKREAAIRNAQSEHRKQIQSLRLDLERKNAELNIMEQKVNLLVKAKVDLLEELEMTKVQAKFKQAELQKEIGSLKHSIQELQQEKQEGQYFEKEIGELKNCVQQLKSQNQSLMVELDAFDEQEKARQQMPVATDDAVADHSQQVRELEDELNVEHETNVELRAQLVAVRQELNDKIDNLEMELSLQRMKFAQAQARLMDMPPCAASSSFCSEEVKALQMKADQAEMRFDQLSQAFSSKEEELKALRNNLLCKNNQVVGLTSQLIEIQNRHRAKSGQVEILQDQVERYRKDVNRFRQLFESDKSSALVLTNISA